MRLSPKKIKSTVVSRSRTYGQCYGDLTLGDAEPDEVKSLRILRVAFGSKLTFEIHLHGVVSKTARSLGIVHRAGKLYDCPRVFKSCFNAYVFFILEYCARASIVPAVSHLSWLDMLFAVQKGCARVNFIVLSTGGTSVACICSIRFITEWATLCMSICIVFFAAHNTGASAALYELALVIARCRTDPFSGRFCMLLSVCGCIQWSHFQLF